MQGPVDHSAMVDWVWRYFSEGTVGSGGSSQGQPPSLMSKLTGPVQLSGRLPASCLSSHDDQRGRTSYDVNASTLSAKCKDLPVFKVSLAVQRCYCVMLIMCTGSLLEVLHCAGKGPLYLQHEGHSRTIIGIEKVFRANGQPPAVAFLILDPSTRTGPLDRALRERKGWQVRLQPHLHVLRAHASR